ncbi:MAG: response regulator transcription factor [Candidatus Binatia bacterium]
MSDSVERSPKIAIFVLNEQPLLRYGISAYLNSQPDMMVCGEAESLLNARSKIAQCQPQLVLTGLRLGTGDSLKSIKKLKAEIPRLLILVYSALEESIFAERAMRAGASGYVMTQAPTDALVSAIREIVGGGIYVSRDVALSAFRKSLRPIPKHNYGLRPADCLEELSNREMHVFQLLASGLTNRQIATSLDLSVKTVESHQENIKHKLYLSSCAEVRKRAAKWMEQTSLAKEHLCRVAPDERKKKPPSLSSPIVEALATQTTATPESFPSRPESHAQ